MSKKGMDRTDAALLATSVALLGGAAYMDHKDKKERREKELRDAKADARKAREELANYKRENPSGGGSSGGWGKEMAKGATSGFTSGIFGALFGDN